jgi:hypothetical protein
LIADLPKDDRTKALNSAISNLEEAAKAILYIHARLNESVGLYKNGYLKTEGYGHSVEAAEQQKDWIFNEDKISNQSDLYNRLADVVGDEKSSLDLQDVGRDREEEPRHSSDHSSAPHPSRLGRLCI